MREAGREPAFAKNVLGDAGLTDDAMDGAKRMTGLLVATHLGLIVLVLAGRGVRRRIHEARRPPVLAHPSGQRLPIMPGATVREPLRAHGIPHAAVCGGRARCTTCRIQVSRGLESLEPPNELEAKALERIAATPGMRLACQVRPTADIAITPLCAADASAADGYVPGGLEGAE